MFGSRFFRRRILARRSIFNGAHDQTFKFVIQPLIIGSGVLFVAYGTARNQKAMAMAYRDPYYPPIHVAPVMREAADWVVAGVGPRSYYCAKKGCVFSEEYWTDSAPTLPKQTNPMAVSLKENPEIWTNLKDQETSGGVTLVKCIKPGVDLPETSVGAIAGDEESYETFRDLFDTVLQKGFGSCEPKSPSSFDVSEISDSSIDPSGEYIIATNLRTSHNCRGFNLPPSTNFLERRSVEKGIVKSLLTLTGDIAGEYFPLNGSRSFVARREGMSPQKEKSLQSKGALFDAESMEKLVSGSCRHWPDARGVFHNQAEDVFVFVNDEDHLSIMARSEGSDFQAAAKRFQSASSGVKDVLSAQGFEMMSSERLGNITASPANLGTSLRAGATMKLPSLSQRSDFAELARGMGLSAPKCVQGVCEVMTAGDPTKTEIEMINTMITSAGKLVEMEKSLASGGSI